MKENILRHQTWLGDRVKIGATDITSLKHQKSLIPQTNEIIMFKQNPNSPKLGNKNKARTFIKLNRNARM